MDIVILPDPLGDQLALLHCQSDWFVGEVAQNFTFLLHVHGDLERGIYNSVPSENLTCKTRKQEQGWRPPGFSARILPRVSSVSRNDGSTSALLAQMQGQTEGQFSCCVRSIKHYLCSRLQALHEERHCPFPLQRNPSLQTASTAWIRGSRLPTDSLLEMTFAIAFNPVNTLTQLMNGSPLTAGNALFSRHIPRFSALYVILVGWQKGRE